MTEATSNEKVGVDEVEGWPFSCSSYPWRWGIAAYAR